MSIIALIFDYDDTIVPDSTTQLLKHFNINPNKFWKEEIKNLVEEGYEPVLAVLKSLLDKIGGNKPFGLLTNKKLRKIGAEIAKTQYSGFEELIKDSREIVNKQRDINIEFYVISGGLEEIIRGNKFIIDNFSGIYGCRITGENKNSELKYIKRAITFTEKTRYLFEINKGISQSVSNGDPSAVNQVIDEKNRPIPFENMIYVGDGLTDIPCFSLIEKNNGMAFGVLHKNRDFSAKLYFYNQVLKTKRVISTNSPLYSKDDDLGELIRCAIASICSKIILNRNKA